MSMKEEFKRIRHEYGKKTLLESEAKKNPFEQFKLWFAEAVENNLPDANAMCLSTVGAKNRPSSRILLLKDFDESGFCFFTNYRSKKGIEIDNNPYGSIVFFWPELERQIRIEGKIVKLEAEKSDTYFNERPIGSRIAAAVSPQSKVIKNREELEQLIDNFSNENTDQIERPSFWGGYKLIPDLFEFWQGRENRLNDRIEYILEENCWSQKRLAP
ncbi:pyridoxamine 5'-phosphate oxidase [Marinifilum caeruleilacunae]|uniref:Pyridoxine/pyridoxamine 5'-phosphate oxidase n=1 Tax=Marinifilum caeruleilacunae TaxID=2499076 RepID=A0ABX1WSP3_9BACT|nr:pyridoxamine 5'-phosphate oxidase [Marinifilum caeruleilacunae]NOU59011.1 pyridoxamine 5'-phosphate oxidase [Marinifilum caeruleilacunae]